MHPPRRADARGANSPYGHWMQSSAVRSTHTARMAVGTGAAMGALSLTVWSLAPGATWQQAVLQASAGLAVGTIVAAASTVAWRKGLPRRAVHAVGMTTCWLVAFATVLGLSGDAARAVVVTLPSIFLGLAITVPVRVTLDAAAAREAA